ncbi:MAG: NlpC/P60 family protein [Bacillota bacterium]|nr:NlpC/P60 family protein [Bacillota bacterium]
MKRKTLSMLVAVGLFVTVNTTVLADPSLDSQLQNKQSQLQENQSQLKSIQDQTAKLEASIEQKDNDIQNTKNESDKINGQIKKTQDSIKAAQDDISKTEDDIKKEQDLYDKRLNTMYKKGSDGYLSVLLDSTSVTDLFSRVEYIKKIAEFDKKLLADFKSKEDELQKKKDALDKENDKLQALKTQYDAKMVQLDAEKASLKDAQTKLKTQEQQYASQISKDNDEIGAIAKKIAAEQQQQRDALARANSSGLVSSTVSRGNASSYNGNTITSIAFNIAYDSNGNCRNIPYVWGGNGPDNFDCSGFVIYVFAQAGLHPFNGTRVTNDMIHYGTTVSRDQLQPGDVIYFGTWDNPHHVAIYMGDGMVIHAPHTGDVVRLANLSYFSDYLVAKRMN